jgi:hypothetical protein
MMPTTPRVGGRGRLAFRLRPHKGVEPGDPFHSVRNVLRGPVGHRRGLGTPITEPGRPAPFRLETRPIGPSREGERLALGSPQPCTSRVSRPSPAAPNARRTSFRPTRNVGRHGSLTTIHRSSRSTATPAPSASSAPAESGAHAKGLATSPIPHQLLPRSSSAIMW